MLTQGDDYNYFSTPCQAQFKNNIMNLPNSNS